MIIHKTTDQQGSFEHPDRALLDAIAEQHADCNQWDGARRRGEIRELLETWNGNRYAQLDRCIAKARPETLEGLVAKAEYALRSWTRQGEERWKSDRALQAATLEQVLEALKLRQRSK